VKKIPVLFVLTLAMVGMLTGCFRSNVEATPSPTPTPTAEVTPTKTPTLPPSAPASPGTDANDVSPDTDVIPDGNGDVSGIPGNEGMVGASPSVSPSKAPQ